MPRRPLFRGLSAGCAALVGLATLFVPFAASSVAAAAPATQQQGSRTVAVSESADLPDTDAGLTVTGSGFDPTVDVYVAVCRADIAESDPLSDCLGGPVPDENDTAGWAEVTSEPEGKRNAAAFAEDGSFTVDLTLAAANDAGVDCVAGGCVLLVRSAGEDAGRPADISIGVSFAAPSSAPTTGSPTSEAASTREPDSVALPDVYLGQQQTVVFSGFTPGEEVEVTVFSEPVNINGVVATAGGVVAITFPITEALVPGVHTVQAIGSESGLIGLGTFTVVPAPVTTSASPESSTSASTASSAPTTTTAEPTTTQSTSAAATTAPPTTTSEAAAPAESADSGSNLAWLWVAIALLVVAIAVAVAVTTSRRRAQQLEQDRLDHEAELVGMAGMTAAQPPVWPTGTGAPYTSPAPRAGYEPHDPGQSYGLLSGHEGDGPALYSGQGLGQGPTERDEPPAGWVGPGDGAEDLPTTAIRPDQGGGSTPVPPVAAEPPATQRFDPSPGAEPPRTQQWAPFGNGDEGDGEPPRRR